MTRRLMLLLVFSTILFLAFTNMVMGVDKLGPKQEKSGIRSIYDPPDRVAPEHFGAVPMPLSQEAVFYPFVGKILSPGDTVGYTYYDYQKNGSMGRQIAIDNSFGRHFNWMNLVGPDMMSYYRYVDYNYQDSSGYWLGAMHVSPPEPWAGYTNIDFLSYSRVVLGYHHVNPAPSDSSPTRCMLAIETSDPGTGSFNTYDIPDSLPGTEYNALWPYVTADFSNRVHIISLEGVTGVPTIRLFGYTRCYRDSDSLKCEAPGVAEVNIPPDETQPSSNMIAVVDSTWTISPIIVSSPVSNKVAIIYTKHRNPTPPEIDCDVYYIESTNGGQDWVDAGSFSGITKNNITNYTSSDFERAYDDLSAVYDYDDSLHISWNAHWFNESTGQYSTRYASLYHWSSQAGIRKIAFGYWPETNPGIHNRNLCKMSISAKQSNNYLYLIWTQFDPDDFSAGGFSNGEIYASASTDGGNSWDVPVNLTNTSSSGCSPGDCESDHWSSLAEEIDDNLHILYVNDRDAGGIAQDEGSFTENPVLYMKHPAWTPGDRPRIAVDHHLYEEINVPDNSFKDTSFQVENLGTAQLYVNVGSSASWIEITSDSSFSIPSGGNPVEVSVRLNGTLYSDVVLHDSIIVASNDSAGNAVIVIPVRAFVVTDEYYYPELAYMANSTMGILESNLGTLGEKDPNGGMYNFEDERNYLYDGSVFLATINSDGDTLVTRDMFNSQFTHAANNLVLDTLDMGDYLIIRSRATFWPFFPDVGTLWPGWWWGVEMTMENLMFQGEEAPVPENVMISSIELYPKSAPAWWPPNSFPTLGDLYLGMVLDWDVPSDDAYINSGAYDNSYRLLGQSGTGSMTDYSAGLAFLDNSAPYGTNIIDNPTYVLPNAGFLDGELYQIASTPGDSVYDQNVDLSSVMTGAHIAELTDTVSLKFALAVTPDGFDDLMNDVNKARIYSGALSAAPPGDVNYDENVDPLDMVYLFAHLFLAGPEPMLWGSGDIDSVAGVNIGDVVYLGDYLFLLASPPQRPPFPEVPPDTLTTDTLRVTLDSHPIPLKYIYNLELTNTDSTWGLAIPLRFGILGGSITCDSVSFLNTRTQSFALRNGLVDTAEQKLLIGLYNPFAGLPPGSGTIAKLFFTLSDSSWAWSISLDTTFVAPSNNLLFVQSGNSKHLVVPHFEAPYFLNTPVPDFVADPVIGEKNLEVSFTDSSLGIIDSWYWSFGDGYSSTSSNPIHTYSQAGSYDVKLIVSNEYGSDSLIKEDYIQVLDKPQADFMADVTVGSPPMGVQFTDNSVGDVSSWSWDFGDGDSSSLQNPYYVYSSLGTYDVTLMVTSTNGSDTASKQNYIFTYPALSGDSVKILSVTAFPNQENVVVPIIQSNDYDSLAKIKIPLTFGDSSLVRVDSISFAGSRAAHFEVKLIDIDDGNAAISIDLITDQSPYLEIGEGLLAKIYLKVKDLVPPGGTIFDRDPSDTVLFVNWDYYTYMEAGFQPGTLFVEKTDTNPPEQPQNLVALSLESGVSLTWDPATEPDFRLYAVYRDTQSFTPNTLSDTLATSLDPFYLDSDVSPGGTYFYRASALDSSWNESEYSDTASAPFGDITPPVITVGPAVIAITDSTGTIYWETDEETDGYVEIWVDTSWVPTDSHTTFLLEHTITLNGLVPSTSYEYRVHSTDSLDNGPTYSGSDFFTTASAPDTTPPQIIFGPAVVYLTHNSATIQWTTDEIAYSKVNYAENVPPSDSVWEPGFVTSHSVAVTDLSSETQYFYTVSSEDPSSNGPTYSDTLTFTTEAAPDTVPPMIVEGPIHSGITHNKAVIDWVTNEISASIVQYGPSELYGSERDESNFVQEHQIVLTNLQDSTLYHYRVGSADPESNGPTWSSDFWYWTHSTPDTIPPIVLTGPYASWINDTHAQIDWTTDELSDSWVYYGLDLSYGSVGGNPTYVTEHSVVLTNLLPDTTYNYYISSTDPSGNTVESEHTGGGLAPLDAGQDQFTTRASADLTPPVIISGPHVRYKTHNQATIEWSTDETGNSIVEYGEDQNYGTTVAYPEATINHTAYLSNLDPGTTYHFRVASTDIAKNGPTYSSDVTFATPADVADTDPPVITVGPEIAYLDQTLAIITWETDEPSDSYMGYELIGGLAERIVGESFSLLTHEMKLSMASSFNVRVFSTDPSGNGPTYSDYFVVTAPTSADVDPPVLVSGPEVAYLSANSAKIEWETDEFSSSFVEYGLSAAYTESEGIPDNASLHQVTLTNLVPSTTYHFRIKSADLFANIYLGSDSTLVTEASSDQTPPAVPADISPSYGDQWIKLDWGKNPEADLSGYNLHRDTALSDTTLPLIASNLPDTTYKDQGLINGVTYYYQLTAVDHNSNESPASEVICSKPLTYLLGDFNGDQGADIVDVVAIVNYLFRGAEGHEPLEAGDVNDNTEITISDVVYLINYLFRDGEDPRVCTIPEEPLARYVKRTKAILGLWFPAQDKSNEIEVMLAAEVEEEVSGMEFDLSFDPSQLEVEEISATERTDKLGLFYNIEPGKIKIGMVDIYGANTLTPGEGSLLKIKFQKKRTQAGVSSAKIENAIVVNTSAEELEVEIRPNKVIRSIPATFSLAQNYPNPFNARTVIRYSLPRDSKVKITIYNILGQKVKVLANEYQSAGHKSVVWDGKNQKGKEVASGVYFYKIKAGDFTTAKKMLLLK